MRSGYAYLYDGGLKNVGRYGDYWSIASGSNANRALYLYFGPTDVSPSYGPDDRFIGFSLRCLQE